MKKDVLKEALKRRRGRSFDAKKFAEKGLMSEDLEEKTSVVMGDGVHEKNIEEQTHTHNNTTDDLAPSEQELESKGVDVGPKKKKDEHGIKPFKNVTEDESEVGGENDDAVFDDDVYRATKKRKPKGLYERMQAKLGQKMRG